MNVKLSIETFLEILQEISSVNLQVKLWLDIENTTGLVSSYAELMNRLDSGEFNYVVGNQIENVDLKHQLNILYSLIEEYKEPKEYLKSQNDVFIVADPNWKYIRDYAKNIRDTFQSTLLLLDRKE